MAAGISQQQIINLANLAKLDLSQAEIESYHQELTAIIALIDQLQEVDVESLPATEQVTHLKDVMRADVERPAIKLTLQDLALNAELHERQFKIPKVNL